MCHETINEAMSRNVYDARRFLEEPCTSDQLILIDCYNVIGYLILLVWMLCSRNICVIYILVYDKSLSYPINTRNKKERKKHCIYMVKVKSAVEKKL